jgi:hypothetical protein
MKDNQFGKNRGAGFMRWLTSEQWSMSIKTTIAAILTVLPFGGPAVDLNPATPTALHSGQMTGTRVGLPDDGRGSLFQSVFEGKRREKELSDDLEAFRFWEEAEEGSERSERKGDDDAPPDGIDLPNPDADSGYRLSQADAVNPVEWVGGLDETTPGASH